MASRKSTQITNRDSTPVVLNTATLGPVAKAFNAVGKITAVGTTDGSGDVYRFFEVPTNARVDSVRLYCAALAGSSAMDVGLYRNTRDGGAVVDADFFASAQSLASALTGTEISHESTVYTLAKREQPLWQAVGLSADPGGTFDVCGTLTATVNTGGDVLLVMTGALPA